MESGSGEVGVPVVDKPREMNLKATVKLLSNGAEAAGVYSIVNHQAKSLIKFKNCHGASSFIQVATLKDTAGPKFNVEEIKNIRSPYLSKGMTTIETSRMTLMIRDANVEELTRFIDKLQTAVKLSQGKLKLAPGADHFASIDPKRWGIIAPATTQATATATSQTAAGAAALNWLNSSSSQTSTVSVPLQLPQEENANAKGPLRQSTLQFRVISVEEKKEIDLIKSRRNPPNQKRARSPGLSKVEISMVKRRLQEDKTSAKITSKSTYLKEVFPTSLTKLEILDINLKKIDNRVLQLANLTYLDLSKNKIKSVDCLRSLNLTLYTLKLSFNEIRWLDPRLSVAFKNLRHLDLKDNHLTMIPDSFAFLERVDHLDVSYNRLTTLPYNLRFMWKLRTLLANNNKLEFMPGSVDSAVAFPSLTRLDVSNNPRDLLIPINTRMKESDLTPGFGTLKNQCPTLMELAGEMLLNNTKCFTIPGRARTTLNIGLDFGGILPETVLEYLYRAKKCLKCHRTSLHYRYYTRTSHARNMADVVISDGLYLNFKHAVCCDISGTRSRSKSAPKP